MSTAAEYVRRLAPQEVSELAALLRGRVGWRGQYALARELGIDVRDLRRAISRQRVAPRTITRIRLALAARSVGAHVVMPPRGSEVLA